jgi:catalase (peroxidase I)
LAIPGPTPLHFLGAAAAACPQAKASLKGTPADGLVSNADLIAWAGARAVAVTGGPRVPLTIGRADARAADPPGRMASERSGPQALIDNFADKGFGVRELVALSGAHTIGARDGGGGGWGTRACLHPSVRARVRVIFEESAVIRASYRGSAKGKNGY